MLERVQSLATPVQWLRDRVPLRRRAAEEPGRRLFRGLRLRLTLWYGVVLALTLLLVGLVLYAGMQYMMLQPVHDQLRDEMVILARATEHASHPCPIGVPFNRGPSTLLPVYIACYTSNGNLTAIGSQDGDRLTPPTAFLNGDLSVSALKNGTAYDIVDGGQGIGPVFRYAAALHDPSDPNGVSVVQLGMSIEAINTSLALIQRLLVLLGVGSLALATIGGLWLSNRALAPARLAFARQQGFIADASHELRTPLTLLRANAEVLLRHKDRFPEDDAELLADIVDETEHMSAMTSNLLTMARLDAGQLTQERDVVDLSRLARDVTRRVHAAAEQKDLTVTEELIAGAVTIGDPAALEQSILILVDNAVKYTPAGGKVAVRTERENGHVRLAVRDNGLGISPEHVPHLTERFYRVDVARSRAAGGAGLGLSIANGIASAHGGRIEIDSRPGEGTDARLVLPAADHAR